MAEEGGTILERIVRYTMQLVGAEEVERRIPEVDRKFREMALGMQGSRDTMRELSQAFRQLGVSISAATLQTLPQTIRFLEQYAIAGEKAEAAGRELTLTEYAQSAAGQETARSLGLISERTVTLKDRFGDLSAAARTLLKVWIAFKMLMGTLQIFQDMARAAAELQAELWRLKTTVRSISDEIEGGAGAWEDWLGMVQRLRTILPFVSTKEIAEGLRTITAIVGPLGLTAKQIETLTGLIGQMSLVVGEDFLPFAESMITAVTGTGRSVASLNLDLRDGSQGLTDYATQAGFVWDELNATQRMYVRLAYATSEMAKRTEEVTEGLKQEFVQLENLQAAREDIRAQAPGLIDLQIKWNSFLLQTDKLLARLAQNTSNWIDLIIERTGPAVALIMAAWDTITQALTKPLAEVQRERGWFMENWIRRMEALGEVTEVLQEVGTGAEQAAGDIGELEQAFLEGAEAAEEMADEAEELADRISRAYDQAQSAVRSYQRSVEEAGIRLSRRLAELIENLEERLADLERAFELRRSELISQFEERRADIREDAAEREEELREDLDKRLRRMEEDHQEEMRQLREDYLLDLEEAARSRDAISMRRIQQRYILEKQQRQREYETNRSRAEEDYEGQLEDLRKAREEQERELEESLERQLRELEENYLRQQEEARLNHERQRQDALQNYQEQLTDLQMNLQERLTDIQNALLEEEGVWEDHLVALVAIYEKFYQEHAKGWLGWLIEWYGMLEKIRNIFKAFGITLPAGFPALPSGIPLAEGAAGIVTQPTSLLVGERGPEFFSAWPVGQRMPSQAMDIRLTIDGTQTGLWSADFETQVLKVFRGVLKEVGL